MASESASVWRKHRALAILADAWPVLESAEPPDCERLDAALLVPDAPWRAVLARPAHRDYVASVVSGVIPTRAGSWHDVFNLVAFARFPATKLALHERMFELQQARRAAGGGDRGREEDALSLIDEGCIVFAGSADAIAEFDRARAIGLAAVDAVVQARGIAVRVLGHALLEHLVFDRWVIGAGVVTVVAEGGWEAIDRALGQRIAAGGFPVPNVSPKVSWPDPAVDRWLT